MGKLKVSFLFGAGAEGSSNFNLPTGTDFLKETMFPDAEFSSEILGALNKVFVFDYFSEIFEDCKGIKYRKEKFNSAQNKLFNKLYRLAFVHFLEQQGNGENIKKNYIEEVQGMFPKYFLSELKTEYEIDFGESSNNKFEDKASKDFEKALKMGDGFQLNISNLILQPDFISCNGVLDECFPSIANPKKFGINKFFRIFNYYWFCYFSIVKGIIFSDFVLNKNELIDYLEDDKKLNYEKIIRELPEFNKKLYKLDFNISDVYYTLIKEKIDDSEGIELKGVLTTNYFQFAEKYLRTTTAYINGKLNLIEFPEKFVISEDKDFDKAIYFPFILGQSITKPVIHPRQIKELSTASSIIDDSDVMVVLGYGINSEDNHVNTLINDFLLKDKKTLIVVTEKSKKPHICKNLRIEEKLEKKIRFVDRDSNKKDEYKTNNEVVEEIFRVLENLKNHN